MLWRGVADRTSDQGYPLSGSVSFGMQTNITPDLARARWRMPSRAFSRVQRCRTRTRPRRRTSRCREASSPVNPTGLPAQISCCAWPMKRSTAPSQRAATASSDSELALVSRGHAAAGTRKRETTSESRCACVLRLCEAAALCSTSAAFCCVASSMLDTAAPTRDTPAL